MRALLLTIALLVGLAVQTATAAPASMTRAVTPLCTSCCAHMTSDSDQQSLPCLAAVGCGANAGCGMPLAVALVSPNSEKLKLARAYVPLAPAILDGRLIKPEQHPPTLLEPLHARP